MGFFKNIKTIHGIRSEIRTLARAYMDERVSMITKLAIALLCLIYIVSPIDLAPDILPLVGISDDILVIPLLMWILLPNHVLEEARRHIAQEEQKEPHTHHWIFWICVSILGGMLIYTIYELLV